MKFYLPFIAITIAQEDDQPTIKKFSNIAQFAYAKATTSMDYLNFRKKLQNYGCHCFPLDLNQLSPSARLPGGRGPPVDEMDSICRELTRCHACVDRDHKSIDTDWGKYKATITQENDIVCSLNQEQGKIDQCLCDKQFAENLAAMWTDDGYNTFYWNSKHNNDPSFDNEAVCQSTIQGTSTSGCCGEYPDRRPYSKDTYQCCADGSVKTPGSC